MLKASNGTQSPDNNTSTNWKATYNDITIYNWTIGRERELRISFYSDLSAENIFQILSSNQFSKKQSGCWKMLVPNVFSVTSFPPNKLKNSLNMLRFWSSFGIVIATHNWQNIEPYDCTKMFVRNIFTYSVENCISILYVLLTFFKC